MRFRGLILAPIVHEIGHIISAGGLVPIQSEGAILTYFRYAPEYDPFTVLMHFAQWNDSVKISGLLFSLILLYKYRSLYFLLYLLFLARWDLLSIYANTFFSFA